MEYHVMFLKDRKKKNEYQSFVDYYLFSPLYQGLIYIITSLLRKNKNKLIPFRSLAVQCSNLKNNDKVAV